MYDSIPQSGCGLPVGGSDGGGSIVKSKFVVCVSAWQGKKKLQLPSPIAMPSSSFFE